jgi:5-hydroxyisourate hydrolase-like protein (transthyretin family)
MKIQKTFSALVILLLAGATMQAGIQGRVSGKVTDSAGNPLEGVTVTLTTLQLKSFKLTTKTDKQGQYGLLVNDATMKYQMKFEKEGYAPVETEKKLSTVEITVVDEKLLKASEAPVARGAAPAAAPAPSFSAVEQFLKASEREEAPPGLAWRGRARSF